MTLPNRMITSCFAPDLFSDTVAIVTGGGTGIGFATARTLSQLGARVALFGRRADVIHKAAVTLDPSGERVMSHACDIRDADQVHAAVTAVAVRMGRVDLLVNNAGGQFPAPAETISPRGFEAVVRNNLLGTWVMTREVATSQMIPGKSGVIVNVIANIERGFPGMVHTGAARAGVENMTKTLAIEWVTHNIRVNAIAPGVIATEGLQQYPPELIENSRRKTPMQRLGTADEVAASIVFMASDAAAFITGVTLYVDGGARLWGDIWPINE